MDDGALRADRRDRLEPDHVVARPAVVFEPRVDRWSVRRGGRDGGRRLGRAARGAGLWPKVILPMFTSPVVGFVGAAAS